MLRKIMIVLVCGIGLATGQAADASAQSGCGYMSGSRGHHAAPTCGGRWLHHEQRLHRGKSIRGGSGYWDAHDCSVPYYYNSFGSWNGFWCDPRR
jgi:hypothetical protein